MGACSSCCQDDEAERAPLLHASPSLIKMRLQDDIPEMSFAQAHSQFTPSNSVKNESLLSPIVVDPPIAFSSINGNLIDNPSVYLDVSLDEKSEPDYSSIPVEQRTPIRQKKRNLNHLSWTGNNSHSNASPYIGNVKKSPITSQPPSTTTSPKNNQHQASPIPQGKKSMRRTLRGSVALAVPALDTLIKKQQADKHRIPLKRLSDSTFVSKLELSILMSGDEAPVCLQAASTNLMASFEAGALNFKHAFIDNPQPSLEECRDMVKKMIEDQTFEILDEEDTAVVANHIRAFLRVLPEPLTTHRNYAPFCHTSTITDELHRDTTLHSLIFSIPKPSRLLLSFMANLIISISDGNQQKVDHLCKFFATSIVRPRDNIRDTIRQNINNSNGNDNQSQTKQITIDSYLNVNENDQNGSKMNDDSTENNSIINNLNDDSSENNSIITNLNDDSSENKSSITNSNEANPSSSSSKSDNILAYRAFKLIVTKRDELFALSFPHATFDFEGGKLLCQSATLDFWIELLLDEYHQDTTLLGFTFTAIDAFISPINLLAQFEKLYRSTAIESAETFIDSDNLIGESPTRSVMSWNARRRLRILFIIKSWLIARSDLGKQLDFLEALSKFVLDTTNLPYTLEHEETMLSSIKSILNNLYSPPPSSKPPQELLSEPSSIDMNNLTSIPVQILAETMTLIDSELFNSISAKDCYGNTLSKNQNTTESSFERIAIQFNKWSSWLQEAIVFCPESSQRSETILYCLHLAEKLLECHNFSGAYATYTALMAVPVSRLQHSWKNAKGAIKMFTALENLFSFHQNFRQYRDALRDAELPIVPQIVIIARHLAAIDESEPTMIGNQINLEKLRGVYHIVQDIQKYQKSSYTHFALHLPLKEYLLDLKVKNEDELYEQSKKVEPKASGPTR